MREQATATALLDWYKQERRALPWRVLGNESPDPYHVWLSEIMLQQTTVATVTPRYARFLDRWPDIHALASASLDDVLHEWQGLGYYARARNLHRCACVVVSEHGGQFPGTEDGLRTLPGIGDYTAAAIAAIAFGQDTAPVDGNIIRVICRFYAIEDIMPGGKMQVKSRVSGMSPTGRSGDFAQAMMDLGAIVCTPRNPLCDVCPWSDHCCALKSGNPTDYPRKAAKKQRPTRYGTVFWLEDNAGRVYLRRRADSGLLGGMMEFPSSDWSETVISDEAIKLQAPVESIDWQPSAHEVIHVFTHFRLCLRVWTGCLGGLHNLDNGLWVRPADFDDYALPTIMKKVAAVFP